MRTRLTIFRNVREGGTDEAGFVLVAAMVVLFALSLFGLWALRTSNFEVEIAGSAQRSEKQFNVAEGAAFFEAGRLGFSTLSGANWYDMSDPSTYNQPLLPPTDGDYDPGNDTNATVGDINPADMTTWDPANWPMQNLLQLIANNEFDYRYLVTYLSPDAGGPPKGYDAGDFSGYQFRIQGQAVQGLVQSAVVEVGGVKVGVKASL